MSVFWRDSPCNIGPTRDNFPDANTVWGQIMIAMQTNWGQIMIAMQTKIWVSEVTVYAPKMTSFTLDSVNLQTSCKQICKHLTDCATYLSSEKHPLFACLQSRNIDIHDAHTPTRASRVYARMRAYREHDLICKLCKHNNNNFISISISIRLQRLILFAKLFATCLQVCKNGVSPINNITYIATGIEGGVNNGISAL